MKQCLLIYFMFFILTVCYAQKDDVKNLSAFSLLYKMQGMGSNNQCKFPAIQVIGVSYVYTNECMNYWTASIFLPREEIHKTDTICVGSLRKASIDSIIQLIQQVPDTVTYATNTTISSGVIQYLIIETDSIERRFVLHNAGHSVADKIVEILNSNLPADKPKCGFLIWNK